MQLESSGDLHIYFAFAFASMSLHILHSVFATNLVSRKMSSKKW